MKFKELLLAAKFLNSLSLGHPVGASGTRILITLLYEIKRKDAHRGLATLYIGGGQGIAIIVER